MKKNKVLLIGPFPEPITGMSKANKVLLDSLTEKGFKVDCINTSLYSFDENVGSFSIKKVLFFLRFNLYLYKIFKVKTIYITPGSTFFGVTKYLLFFTISNWLNKKIIVHIHTNNLQFEYEKVSEIKKKMMSFVLKKATYGIVLAPSIKNNLTPFLSKENIFVVKNFVEENIISTKEKIRSKSIETLNLVFLSNLMTQKGIFYLLEALENLQNKIKFKIKFAGYIDNNNKEEVLARIEKIPNASYLGVVKGNEKKKLLEWSNVFIFPSYLTEGLPLSVLEAFATGNYVISTVHPSLVDFFDKNAIHFINKKSAKHIEQAVLDVSSKYSKEQILKNYHFVVKNFTVSNFSEKIIEIIKK